MLCGSPHAGPEEAPACSGAAGAEGGGRHSVLGGNHAWGFAMEAPTGVFFQVTLACPVLPCLRYPQTTPCVFFLGPLPKIRLIFLGLLFDFFFAEKFDPKKLSPGSKKGTKG